MKIGISQKLLLSALDRGAMAALSDEAQADTSNVSVLLKAVTIKATTTSITFESATKLLATRHTVYITKDNGIEVKEAGEATVPAKDLYDWAVKQGDCRIGLAYTALEKPENITPVEEGKSDKNTIKKVGNLKTISKDATTTGTKWSCESYSRELSPSVNFKPDVKAAFSAPAEQLGKGMKSLSIATSKKDYEHVLDGVSFQQKSGKLYMMTTDMVRIAVYGVTGAEDITLDEAPEGKEAPKDNYNVVINAKTFQEFIKLSDQSGKITVYYDTKLGKIFIEQNDTVARISAPEKEKFSKIPPVTIVLNKKYETLFGAPTKLLLLRLGSLLVVNKEAVQFTFKKDADKAAIYGISECGKSPQTAAIPVNGCKKDCAIVWNINHIMDVLGIIEGEETTFMVPPSGTDSVKIFDKADPNFVYVSMSIEQHKYNSDKSDKAE